MKTLVTRWIEHGSGGYWDYCDFPLANATVDEVAAWPFADPAHFDYSQIEQAIDAHSTMGVHCGNPGIGCIMNTIGFLRGMEQMFIDLIADEEAGLLLIDKLMDLHYGLMERTLEAGKGKIDQRRRSGLPQRPGHHDARRRLCLQPDTLPAGQQTAGKRGADVRDRASPRLVLRGIKGKCSMA